jgi:hypothetical protein
LCLTSTTEPKTGDAVGELSHEVGYLSRDPLARKLEAPTRWQGLYNTTRYGLSCLKLLLAPEGLKFSREGDL